MNSDSFEFDEGQRKIPGMSGSFPSIGVIWSALGTYKINIEAWLADIRPNNSQEKNKKERKKRGQNLQ